MRFWICFWIVIVFWLVRHIVCVLTVIEAQHKFVFSCQNTVLVIYSLLAEDKVRRSIWYYTFLLMLRHAHVAVKRLIQVHLLQQVLSNRYETLFDLIQFSEKFVWFFVKWVWFFNSLIFTLWIVVFSLTTIERFVIWISANIRDTLILGIFFCLWLTSIHFVLVFIQIERSLICSLRSNWFSVTQVVKCWVLHQILFTFATIECLVLTTTLIDVWWTLYKWTKYFVGALHVDVEKSHTQLTWVIDCVASLVETHLISAYELIVLVLIHLRFLNGAIKDLLLISVNGFSFFSKLISILVFDR